MIELKLRYGGHGGIPTQWEISIRNEHPTYPQEIFEQKLIQHFYDVNDVAAKIILRDIPSIWPIQHAIWGDVNDVFSVGSLILPEGVSESEASAIVDSLIKNQPYQLGLLYGKILARVCQNCKNCLKVENAIHDCEGNHFNMTPDCQPVENPATFSGCLRCEDRCEKCPNKK